MNRISEQKHTSNENDQLTKFTFFSIVLKMVNLLIVMKLPVSNEHISNKLLLNEINWAKNEWQSLWMSFSECNNILSTNFFSFHLMQIEIRTIQNSINNQKASFETVGLSENNFLQNYNRLCNEFSIQKFQFFIEVPIHFHFRLISFQRLKYFNSFHFN